MCTARVALLITIMAATGAVDGQSDWRPHQPLLERRQFLEGSSHPDAGGPSHPFGPPLTAQSPDQSLFDGGSFFGPSPHTDTFDPSGQSHSFQPFQSPPSPSSSSSSSSSSSFSGAPTLSIADIPLNPRPSFDNPHFSPDEESVPPVQAESFDLSDASSPSLENPVLHESPSQRENHFAATQPEFLLSSPSDAVDNRPQQVRQRGRIRPHRGSRPRQQQPLEAASIRRPIRPQDNIVIRPRPIPSAYEGDYEAPVYEYDDEDDDEDEEEEPDRLAILLQSSSFNCLDRKDGYYADEEVNCEVFHYCQDRVKHSWLCPENASFHQVHLICMPRSEDNICEKSSKFHFVNDFLYKEIEKGPNKTYADRYYPENFSQGLRNLPDESVAAAIAAPFHPPLRSRYEDKGSQDYYERGNGDSGYSLPPRRPQNFHRPSSPVEGPQGYVDLETLLAHEQQQQQQQQQQHLLG
ncbi:uncharacterized protein LOC143040910 [Oratosquilla oratoria]|uniref:uncharacterized protein LOC143040910 n=1 Tax=Oratosquilla oratoria TaxID=337810 RepID=UPI003F7695CC